MQHYTGATTTTYLRPINAFLKHRRAKSQTLGRTPTPPARSGSSNPLEVPEIIINLMVEPNIHTTNKRQFYITPFFGLYPCSVGVIFTLANKQLYN